jgi:methyl-accepting chemotaxis protein
MAATTVALSVFAVSNARFHATLTEEFESANAGSWNVERINGLIYTTAMDTRGIYMSADTAEASKYADSLVKAADQISAVTGDWQRSVRTIREIGNISSAIAAAVTEQGAATQEIARGVEVAAERTVETAKQVNLMGQASNDTRSSAATVKAVADDLGSVASRIRAQVDQFFERLSA